MSALRNAPGRPLTAACSSAVTDAPVVKKSFLADAAANHKDDDLELPVFDPSSSSSSGLVDLVIAGGGPSGLTVAERVSRAGENGGQLGRECSVFFSSFVVASRFSSTSTSTSSKKINNQKGYSVVIVDPNPLAPWPNTYGVWCDEFEAMGLDDCLEFTWPRANVFLDSTPAGKRELQRPYGRVDRRKLKRRLLSRCVENGVRFLGSRAEGVEHGESSSTLSVSRGSGGGRGRGSNNGTSTSASTSATATTA